MNQWIKCSEKLPEPFEKVLVIFQIEEAPVRHFFVGYMDDNKEWYLLYLYESIPINKAKLIPLFWMPLPEPPSE